MHVGTALLLHPYVCIIYSQLGNADVASRNKLITFVNSSIITNEFKKISSENWVPFLV